MKPVRRPDSIELTFLIDDLRAMGNALNEVLNGFEVQDFQMTIGPEDVVHRLHQHLADVYRASLEDPTHAFPLDLTKSIEIHLDNVQVGIVIKAFKLMLIELTWDLETRMGCTENRVHDLINRLETELIAANP